MNKKKWHEVRDSVVDREDGKGKYFNVEARFSDHPVINVEKSRIARHNVHDYAIILHTRVKKVMGDAKAQENMSAQPIRFDKGRKQGLPDFEACKALITRCWNAWEYYQGYRQAPVTPSEEAAMHQIALARAHRQSPGKVMVDIGDGVMVERYLDPDGEDREEDEDDAPQASVPQVPRQKTAQPQEPARPPKATPKPKPPRKPRK